MVQAIEVSHLELFVTLLYPYPRHTCIQTESYSYEHELVPERTTKYPPSSYDVYITHDNMLRARRYIRRTYVNASTTAVLS